MLLPNRCPELHPSPPVVAYLSLVSPAPPQHVAPGITRVVVCLNARLWLFLPLPTPAPLFVRLKKFIHRSQRPTSDSQSPQYLNLEKVAYPGPGLVPHQIEPNPKTGTSISDSVCFDLTVSTLSVVIGSSSLITFWVLHTLSVILPPDSCIPTLPRAWARQHHILPHVAELRRMRVWCPASSVVCWPLGGSSSRHGTRIPHLYFGRRWFLHCC